MATTSPVVRETRKDSVHAQDGQKWQMTSGQDFQEASVLDAATCLDPGARGRRRSAKRKDESLSESIRAAIVDHQLGLSINCLLLLVLTHLFFPTLRPTTIQFLTFSYRDSKTGLYNPGWNDLKHLVFWIVVFTGLRAGTMDYILIPFAKCCGMKKKKATIRFAEQAWLLVYYAVFWSVGMYLYVNSNYFMNISAVWEAYPTRGMTGLFKWYYLAQFAFWLQQIVVVHIEERRKDHWQMFTHHIITSLLIFGSYGSYQTKVGNVILCLMDVVDLIFPLAKMLRYCGYQTLCDIAFGVFMVTWFIARHVCYLAVCWSLYVDTPYKVLPYACYDAKTGAQLTSGGGDHALPSIIHAYTDGAEPVCWNSRIRSGFMTLLLALQVITIIWGGMICRVAYKVLSGQGADDSRSDDEGDDESEDIEADETDPVSQLRDFPEKEPEIQTAKAHAPKEEEVGVEELRFVRRTSHKKSAAKKKQGMSSGISIPGHGDKKELLGRIGCDKPGS